MYLQKQCVDGFAVSDIPEKKSFLYIEASEEKRQIYLKSIENIDSDKLVYLDECGIDDNESYAYAWGKKGHRVHAKKPAKRNKRLSIISVLNQNNLQAPFLFEGSCTRDVFITYLKKVLIPNLNEGQVVVLDNASFHKGGNIEQIIKEAGCTLLYLPPYSPDFNPIEHHWASVKHRIKILLPLCNRDIYLAAYHAFQEVLS